MMKQNINLKSLLLLLFVIGSMSGCATVKGIGEDVEAAGEAVQEAAES
ncbi:entericidin A/B family lipoprotein [Planctobacterium marinum]|uniref:Uncharacterized protein n=1 Tax=Planctobacterium marinum TaxID=1631968 RepID=A0AA48HP99_9ALTE|nr:hypothetical protein MACH26_39770 [Planctobacterium marinum]